MENIDDEMNIKLPNNYWQTLKTYGEVGCHSIMVLLCHVTDSIFIDDLSPAK